MTGKSGSLGNNTGIPRVEEFGDIIFYSYIHLKFGHLENMMMGGTDKALVDKSSIEAAAHSHDDC